MFRLPDDRHKVAIICKVGNDDFGARFIQFFKSEGLTTDGVMKDEQNSTGSDGNRELIGQ